MTYFVTITQILGAQMFLLVQIAIISFPDLLGWALTFQMSQMLAC